MITPVLRGWSDVCQEEPRTDGAEKPQRGVLTRREAELAALVAQGMSNRKIAANLVLSQCTAEAHVEHILTKLGFTSRTPIAMWMAKSRQ